MSAVDTQPLARRWPPTESKPPRPRRTRLEPRSLRVRVTTVLVLAATGTTILLAVPALRRVLADMSHASAAWLMSAVALELASCLSFIVIFRRFFDSVPRHLARELAWTEMGSGALLPGGGIGSLAAGGWLLHLAGMPTKQIVRRSSGLFFLTSAVNVTALIGGGLLSATGLSGPHDLVLSVAPIVAALVAAAAAIALPSLLRRRSPASHVPTWATDLLAGIGEAEDALLRPSWRLLGAIGYLGFDIAVLWATLHAVGYSPALATLVLGYIVGYLANLIPIPGGIGVLEGGLAGTLILYGAPPAQTAAGVLIYHAIAFWLPSLGGLWAYRKVNRQLTGAAATRSTPGYTAPRRTVAGSSRRMVARAWRRSGAGTRGRSPTPREGRG